MTVIEFYDNYIWRDTVTGNGSTKPRRADALADIEALNAGNNARCVNCWDCVNCRNCEGCRDCEDCEDCKNLKDCKRCVYCKDSHDLEGCNDCRESRNLKGEFSRYNCRADEDCRCEHCRIAHRIHIGRYDSIEAYAEWLLEQYRHDDPLRHYVDLGKWAERKTRYLVVIKRKDSGVDIFCEGGMYDRYKEDIQSLSEGK